MPTEATQATETQEKIVFTPEQQEKVNQLIKEAMGRAGREARTSAETLAAENATLKADLEAAKSAVSHAKTPSEKKEAKADLEALQAQMEEMKRAFEMTKAESDRWKQTAGSKDKELSEAKQTAQNVLRRAAIRDASSKHGFVDPGDVVKLTEDLIKWDTETNSYQVLAENGTPRLNASMEPMSIEEFYQELATKKPHLVRSDMKPGVGATQSSRSGMQGKYSPEQIFGSKSNSRLANDLAKTNYKEYARLKVLAKEQGII